MLAVGTVVTGSGPHSGDPAAGRTGLDPGAMSQLHADLVMLLVGATVGPVRGGPASVRATAGSPGPRSCCSASSWRRGRWASRSTSPGCRSCSSALHLAGACVVLVAAVHVVLATRDAVGYGSRAATARAHRCAEPGANLRNSDGSVSSSSITTGAPSGPGTRSTRA